MGGINVNTIVDDLISSGKINPLIVVLPHIARAATLAPFDDYLAQELVLFIDQTYRTIPRREARVISGHSRGGHDALHIASKYPQLFSLVGGYGAGAIGGGVLQSRDVVAAHNQAQ